MSGRAKSLLLVGVQFVCLIAIALTGPLLARRPFLLAVELTGAALGLWAIIAMRPFNFNITPDVKAEGYLVARGPYAYIRHPMYASLLLIGAALVLDALSVFRLVIYIVLAVNLAIKLTYEERLLSAHYAEYKAYMAHTKRLVPYIW